VITLKTKEYIEKNTILEQEYELIMEIAKLRLDKNITQKELSNLTGIPQPNIARFEKNTHSASLTTTIKILNSLGYKLKVEPINKSLTKK